MFNPFRKVHSITTRELQSLLDKHTQLIDIRSESEFQSSHIKEATNIPLQEIDRYNGDKSKTVYVICQSGARSRMAAQLLEQQGYDVINILGGMNQWSGPII